MLRHDEVGGLAVAVATAEDGDEGAKVDDGPRECDDDEDQERERPDAAGAPRSKERSRWRGLKLKLGHDDDGGAGGEWRVALGRAQAVPLPQEPHGVQGECDEEGRAEVVSLPRRPGRLLLPLRSLYGPHHQGEERLEGTGQ
jgi:hypothetical protein